MRTLGRAQVKLFMHIIHCRTHFACPLQCKDGQGGSKGLPKEGDEGDEGIPKEGDEGDENGSRSKASSSHPKDT